MGAEAWALEPVERTSEIWPDRNAPATARWFLWSTAAQQSFPAEIETAALLLSEVVSNACRHGSPDAPIAVTCRFEGERVQVAVRNCGPRFDPRHAATRGYGLQLVATLSGSWEARSTADGMEVWFEV